MSQEPRAVKRHQVRGKHDAGYWIGILGGLDPALMAFAAAEQGVSHERKLAQVANLVHAAIGTRRVTLRELSAAIAARMGREPAELAREHTARLARFAAKQEPVT